MYHTVFYLRSDTVRSLYRYFGENVQIHGQTSRKASYMTYIISVKSNEEKNNLDENHYCSRGIIYKSKSLIHTNWDHIYFTFRFSTIQSAHKHAFLQISLFCTAADLLVHMMASPLLLLFSSTVKDKTHVRVNRPLSLHCCTLSSVSAVRLHDTPYSTVVILWWLTAQDKYEQYRQCTYNVTLRRVRATIVAVEKQWVLHNLSLCTCNLRHPARNAHAPYCHLLPVQLYNIFPHNHINSTIFFKKKLLNTKCMF